MRLMKWKQWMLYNKKQNFVIWMHLFLFIFENFVQVWKLNCKSIDHELWTRHQKPYNTRMYNNCINILAFRFIYNGENIFGSNFLLQSQIYVDKFACRQKSIWTSYKKLFYLKCFTFFVRASLTGKFNIKLIAHDNAMMAYQLPIVGLCISKAFMRFCSLWNICENLKSIKMRIIKKNYTEHSLPSQIIKMHIDRWRTPDATNKLKKE